MSASQSQWHDRVYNLMTQYPIYGNFSNAAWISDMTGPGNYDSLESVHNDVHWTIGGNGHMNMPPWSGFDPVFMLHHA